MAKLEIGPWVSKLKDLSPTQAAAIKKVTTVQRDYFRTNNGLSPFVYFFNRMREEIETGLVPMVLSALEDVGQPITDISNPTPPWRERVDGKIHFQLDPGHQVPALDSMLKTNRGIIKAATNAGKTKIAAAWCALSGFKTLYLVPSRDVFYQAVESFRQDTNLTVGELIAGGKNNNTDADVVVALVTSICRRVNGVKKRVNDSGATKASSQFENAAASFEAVIVDECHHAIAKTWRGVLKKLTSAHYRFGMSGTPWSKTTMHGKVKENLEDRFYVTAAFGEIIYEIPNSVLIDRGWSARPSIFFIESYQPVFPDPTMRPEYREFKNERNAQFYVAQVLYEEGIVLSESRNRAILEIAVDQLERGNTCLILVDRLQQIELLDELLKMANLHHEVIVGSAGRVDRNRRIDALERFKSGETKILLTTVLGEGVNIGELRSIIIAGGGKSSKKIIQRVGRGLRKKGNGANTVEIFDFNDTGHKKLKKLSAERRQVYASEGFQIIDV